MPNIWTVEDIRYCQQVPVANPFTKTHPMQFSLHCTKYDRHGYKARQRIFVITEKVSDGLFSDTVGHNLAPNLHTRVATYWNQEISK